MKSSIKHSPFNPPVESRSWHVPGEIAASHWMEYLQESTGWEKSVIEEVINQGGLFVDKKRYRDSQKSISAGSALEIFRFIHPPQAIELNQNHLLYEDKDILAVNKPAWLPVQGTKVSLKFCLEEQLRLLTQNSQLMAIHRLDRQTSGVVLFGKDARKTGWMMKQFASRKVQKKYLALVEGKLPEAQGEIKGYMARNFRELPKVVYRLFAEEKKKSKMSHTLYQVLESRDSLSLVEASPVTGRTHQLRVHFASLNCPIVGDYLYAKKKLTDSTRIQLHASQIEFPLMSSSSKKEVLAPWPEDFIWQNAKP